MAKIRLVTDSTADIPVNLREELDIAVLPISIISGEKEYKDGYDLTPQEFYEILEASEELPTTSRVVPADYQDLYEESYEMGYTDIIVVCLNSKGSSTLQGAIMSKDMFFEENPDAKDKINIVIIDSLTYSGGYGLPVVEAAKMIKNGASPQEIVDYIEDFVKNVRPVVIPFNLQYAKKSGRVSAASAFVGDALGLKPIIAFEDGESKVLSKVRGDKKAMSTLVDMAACERKPGTPYVLVYGNNAEAYEKFKAMCIERLGEEPTYEYAVGCVISLNIGPDMVAVIYRK